MTLATRQDVERENDKQLAASAPPRDMRAPVGDGLGLKSLLNDSKRGIAEMLPKHITPERLIKTLLVAANRNPKLFECTRMSVLETINRAAELGLDLSGTLGEAYPVPYGNVCTLIIGYRGLEKLAWQSGEIASIDAEVVYEKDDFKFKKGTEVVVEWAPFLKGDRGEIVGAYACVTMKSGGKLARFLPVSEIEKVRAVSKSGKSGPWTQWWDEMARKTALRRVLKDAPLSTEKFAAAMDHDAEDARFDVVEAETNRPRGTNALVDKLKARGGEVVDPETGEVRKIPPAPSEEEAERILAEKSSTTPDRAATPDGVRDQPAGDEGHDIPPDDASQVTQNPNLPPEQLPEAARKGAGWIDEQVKKFKGGFTVRSFHAQHGAVSWENLTREEQDKLWAKFRTNVKDVLD